jgi:hypothetical protein
MGNDLAHLITILGDLEVKAPVLIDSSLPAAFGFVVLLRVQGRMRQFRERKFSCLMKAFWTAAGAAANCARARSENCTFIRSFST